jgi:hypothetical protein
MRRRVLEVELNNAYDALVRGPCAHQLVIEVTGRVGVWSRQRRGYAVQERTARTIVALAEHLNYDVLISGPRARQVVRPQLELEDVGPHHPPAEAALW